MNRNYYKNKNIAVIGLARTGLALVEVLCALGAKVTVYDKKNVSELGNSVDEAIQMGAKLKLGSDEVDLKNVDLLIPSPGVPSHLKAFKDAEELGVEVISEIELAYRISLAPIIAITGTNGKTTTTVLTGRIMMADERHTLIAGNVAGAGENLGSEIEFAVRYAAGSANYCCLQSKT